MAHVESLRKQPAQPRLAGLARAPQVNLGFFGEWTVEEVRSAAAIEGFRRVALVGAGQPVAGVDPVEQHLRHLGRRVPLGKCAEAEVVILRPSAVAKAQLEHLAFGKERRIDDRQLDEPHGGNPPRLGQRVAPLLVALHRPDRLAKRIDDANAATDHIRAGVVQQRKLFFEPGGMREVVGVHPRDHRRGRLGGSAIGRGADAKCVLLNQAQARIGNLPNDRRAVIGGAVVDDNEFELAKGGIENGTCRTLNRRRCIAHRQNHRDPWRSHLAAPGFFSAGTKSIEAELTQ